MLLVSLPQFTILLFRHVVITNFRELKTVSFGWPPKAHHLHQAPRKSAYTSKRWIVVRQAQLLARSLARTEYDYLMHFLINFRKQSRPNRTSHVTRHLVLLTSRTPSITSDRVKFCSFNNSNSVAINLLIASNICQTFSYIVIPVHCAFFGAHLAVSY